MLRDNSFLIPRENESVDEYYSRIFLESHEGMVSESVFHAKQLDALVAQELSSVNYMVVDRLLNRERDFERVVQETVRVLKPSGTIFATLLAVAPELPSSPGNLWGFTSASALYLFRKYFNPANVSVEIFGNVLSGRFLLEGKLANQLSEHERAVVDPHFPVVVGVVATK